MSVTLNPLSLMVGRVGFNVEYMVIKHVGIMFNPFFYKPDAPEDTTKARETALAFELGLHLYAGKRGANGFYFGPSLIVSHHKEIERYYIDNSQSISEHRNVDSIGFAFDLGHQSLSTSGFTVGAGLGYMYLGETTPFTYRFMGHTRIPSTRFLFTVGYSF